jgi:hypothetical protein
MNRNKKRSQKQEARIASDLGGKVQKASGATDFAKGDVRAENLLIEAKTTGQKSYRVDVTEIVKIQAEALEKGASDWAMQIEFQGQFGHNKKVAVIDWESYLDLRHDSHNIKELRFKLKGLEK